MLRLPFAAVNAQGYPAGSRTHLAACQAAAVRRGRRAAHDNGQEPVNKGQASQLRPAAAA